MKRLAAAFLLVWRLCAAVACSGWQITWRILRPAQAVMPGFIEYRFTPMDPAAAAVLAGLICLTPGTTAVDVDPAAGRMRLHLLDARAEPAGAALQEIRTLFEPLVRALFDKETLR